MSIACCEEKFIFNHQLEFWDYPTPSEAVAAVAEYVKTAPPADGNGYRVVVMPQPNGKWFADLLWMGKETAAQEYARLEFKRSG